MLIWVCRRETAPAPNDCEIENNVAICSRIDAKFERLPGLIKLARAGGFLIGYVAMVPRKVRYGGDHAGDALPPRNPSRRSWLSEEPFVAHRLALVSSSACGIGLFPLRKVLDRLEIEHLRHGGAENGALLVAYRQFVEFGMSRKDIRPALNLGVMLGLIEVLQPTTGWEKSSREHVSADLPPCQGARAPTDEWRDIDDDRAQSAVSKAKSPMKWTRRSEKKAS